MNTIHDAFAPHGICFLWDGWILAKEVGGNLLIATSYFLIPLALLRIRGRSQMIHQLSLGMWLFAAFIFCCGVGHVIDVVVIWYPIYGFASSWDLLTGVVSAFTAILLLPELSAWVRSHYGG